MEGFHVKGSEAFCLGASLGASGLLYYLYKKNKTTLDKLDIAPHLRIDCTLKDILKATPGACITYAVIEGTVQPVGEPLMSHYQKETKGVLQKFTLSEHRLVWSSLTRTWMDNIRVLHQRENAVPFVLVGSDETPVRVLSPLQASGTHMEVMHEKFHQVSSGLVDIVGQYLSGVKPKGQLETEEMLKVGAALIGAGELALAADGTVSLQPPSDGSEYFLGLVDFESLQGELKHAAYWCKRLAICSALVGTAVLLWVCRRYYCHRKAQQEQERERIEFERLLAEEPRVRASPDVSRISTNSVGEEIQNVCVICFSEPRNCIIMDCGHVCCCYSCYQALVQRKCPICRQAISRVLPLHFV